MRPHYTHSSRENATPPSGTSPLASFEGVPPPRAYNTANVQMLSLGYNHTDELMQFQILVGNQT